MAPKRKAKQEDQLIDDDDVVELSSDEDVKPKKAKKVRTCRHSWGGGGGGDAEAVATDQLERHAMWLLQLEVCIAAVRALCDHFRSMLCIV